MAFSKGIIPGVLLVLVVTVLSLLFSFAHSAFDPLVLSIIVGLLLSSLIRAGNEVRSGVEESLRVTLPAGIALYGMKLDVSGFMPSYLPMTAFAFLLMFALSYLFSRYVAGLGQGLSFLIATGLSVCGASAIVVVAAAAGTRREDTTVSIISVMITGLTGMIIFRLLAGTSLLTTEGAPLLIGTTLPMFGQVKVAARAFGESTLHMAVNYKLVRISALALVALVALAIGRKEGFRGGSKPWFMAVFFLLAILSNVSEDVASLRAAAGHASSFLLTAALASIGLSVDLDVMLEKGTAPPLAAGVSWGIASLIIALVVAFTFN